LLLYEVVLLRKTWRVHFPITLHMESCPGRQAGQSNESKGRISDMKTIVFFSHCHTGTGMDGANRILLTTALGVDSTAYRKTFISPGAGVISKPLSDAGIKEIITDYDCFGFQSHIFNYNNKDDFEGICARLEDELKDTELHRLFNRLKPDIVYVNSALAVPGAILGKMVGARVLWHIHEINSNYLSAKNQENLNKVIDRYSDKVIAVARASVKALGTTGSSEKCELIYNGVEDPGYTERALAYKRRVLRREFNLDDGNTLFAFLGQIIPAKGVAEFIRAADKALTIAPGARFMIIGNPKRDISYTRKLIRLIKRTLRSDEIQFAGYCNNISDLLPAVDCLVVPSTYEDPMPTVMIEASLFRIPIAAFNSGGISEFVISGKNGIVVDKGNINQLASAMGHIAKNPRVAAIFGRYSYKRAVNKYGHKRYIENINDILKEMEIGNYRGDPCRSGRVVKGSGPQIYYIENRKKRYIVNENALYNNGLDESDIIVIDDGILKSIPDSKPML
jgi:glycosyltransferase involved in cell wall biosynthesis